MENLKQKTKKDVYDQEYKKINYDQVAIRVKKGKREEYQQAADRLGLSYSEMIRLAIETFIAVRSGEEFTPTRPDSLSANEKELLDVFNQLPDDAQKGLIKTCKTINQLIEDALDERQRYRDDWITASNAKQQLEEEVEKLKKNQPQNQAP